MMKKMILSLASGLLLISATAMATTYNFNFNSGNGVLNLTGTLEANSQNIITGGNLLSTGTEYHGYDFIVGSLTSVLGPCPQGVSYPGDITYPGGISTFMGYGGTYATYDNALHPGNPSAPFDLTNWTVNQNIILAASTNNSTSPGTYLTLAYDGGTVYDSYNITESSQSDTVFYNAQASISLAPVPEPGTMMLLGAGFFGLAIFGKRRKNA